MNEEIKSILAIDVHAHFGIYRSDPGVLYDEFMSADVETVIERAAKAKTRLTIVSPFEGLLPRFNGNPVAGNINAEKCLKGHNELRLWVVVDPNKPETYEQADRLLKLPMAVGIKIHPEEHGYPIVKHGRAIFEFAARHNTVIMTHSGHENSLPEDFVNFANDYPEIKLILAHLGCTCDDDPTHQVRAIQASRHGNIFTDTSSAQSIRPNLIEWAVKEIGAGKILYGSDSPCYFAPMQRARIDNAEIGDEDKKMILCENAQEILNL